jgi:hypothetical protein
LKGRSVEEIEHSSSDHAEKSCDPIRLRVKSDLTFGCSISWSNKRRSITELNTDSHSQRFIVKVHRRQTDGTLRFCGVAPALESDPSVVPFEQHLADLPNAGSAPAFSLRAAFAASGPARRAEFISVSGQCSDRSAHNSDMRHSKRTSGGVAATVPPHAPMNSSNGRFTPSARVATSTTLH